MLTASATFSVRKTSSNQENFFKCDLIDSGAGKDWLATGGGLGFLVMYAGRILVYASGSSGTFLTFIFYSSLSGSRSSPGFPVFGCWKMDTLVPCKDVSAVVAVGL